MNHEEIVSQSLIVHSSKPEEEYKKFCLGLPGWCPCCADNNMAENNPNGRNSEITAAETIP